MTDVWRRLPADAQDALLMLALLAAPLALGLIIARGLALRPLLRGLLWRYRWTSLVFVALVAISVGLGVALLAQERAIRAASAKVAGKFDVVVGAPGDEVALMLATVYLQPASAPLLDGHVFAKAAQAEGVRLAAPIAFGDSYQGAPVVGSTAAFVTHLAGDIVEGRMWRGIDEAVIGAKAPLSVGDRFTPAHGHDALADHDAHDGVRLHVTGRMAPTGGPWDRAVIVPIESVWRIHGLATGHAPVSGGEAGPLGPPFDPAFFPGAPAIILGVDSLSGAYRLRAEFSTRETMAFFPGAVLARLHGLMGDARAAMSVLALATQALVGVAVVAGLTVLARLFARNLSLLRALGAPARMVFALVWAHAACLLGAGGVLGLAVGWLAARAISVEISARTDLVVEAGLGWGELHLAAGFLGISSLLALLPAALALTRPVIEDLRG